MKKNPGAVRTNAGCVKKGAPLCCLNQHLIEDHKSGDVVCEGCGKVSAERIISEEAEYRIFSDDSSSAEKVRVGAAYNPYLEHRLTTSSHWEREEKEFLWDGFKNIDETLERIFSSDMKPQAVQGRAKDLFQKAFRLQVSQKESKKRVRFAKRKQYVVASIFRALEENNISTFTLDDLNDQLEGIQVSKESLKRCLKELKVCD
eukprot:TRINITY_DN4202_c1_g1_i1.p1 TRINITY_DN4202_c1_g1~~TRINITY_DN4202_c1_g1_i1.p1  ORF type:complete len:212 (+),score=85.53 TRINITY_DN4202_c1_g1_i1:30-638(+)